MKIAADIPDGGKIEVHCRQCSQVTIINHKALKKRSPNTTIVRIKERARCQWCNASSARIPGSTHVVIEG